MAEPVDVHDEVFCCDEVVVFHPVVHANQVWKEDPFDVEEIHQEARDAYDRLLRRLAQQDGGVGRVLLLKGEAGAGKTHLIRALRNRSHAEQRAYVAYMQLTTEVPNYGWYIVRNVVDSLNEPYHDQLESHTALERLSDRLAEDTAVPAERREALREGDLDEEALGDLVHGIGDRLLATGRFPGVGHLDVLTALLYLQRRDPPTTTRVFRYLRGVPLSDRDRRHLGGIAPIDQEDPVTVLAELANLMAAVDSVPLVVALDQLEDMYSEELGPARFRAAMQAVRSIQERVHHAVVLIACLENLYGVLRPHLTKPLLDRVEEDPPPVRLDVNRSEAEIRALIQRRLAYLYDAHDVSPDEAYALYPFPEHAPRQLAGMSTREVLEHCRRYRQACIREGWVHPWPQGADSSGGATPPTPQSDLQEVERAWNDFRNVFSPDPPDTDAAQAELLAWAVEASAAELATGHRLRAVSVDGRLTTVRADVDAADHSEASLLVGLCNNGLQGGGLGGQVDALQSRATEEGRVPIAARSGDFPEPKSPRSRIKTQLGNLVRRGGRKVGIAPADWHNMQALRAFRQQHGSAIGEERLARWQREERPLTALPSIRSILDVDRLTPVEPDTPAADPGSTEASPSTERAETPPPSHTGRPASPASRPTPAESVCLGTEIGVAHRPAALACPTFARHAGILGQTGSGKTVLALRVVEQLLLRGVPAILVDRKGDLASAAAPEAWGEAPQVWGEASQVGGEAPQVGGEAPQVGGNASAHASAELETLRRSVAVHLYTPAEPSGRPLSISLLPSALASLSPADRDATAQYAAASLTAMTSQKPGRGMHDQFVAILKKAISLLATHPNASVDLETLVQMVGDRDPSLLSEVGRLDEKYFKRLTEELETLRINRSRLISGEGEALDVGAMLRPSADGRTPLTVISTKFLGDQESLLFWVSQLLTHLGRYASAHPSRDLQAVVLFDEADLYLPAASKPPTKAPMENLLRRARSAGLGVLLATQNPGDFDYRCADQIATWLVGRITQNRAIEKVRPLLEPGGADPTRLPRQRTGEFIFTDGEGATRLSAAMSHIRPDQLDEQRIASLARGDG